MTADLVLRGVLGVLAAYHLVMGVAATFAPAAAARMAGGLYGLRVAESPALRYGARMLGLHATALGALLLVATLDPRGHAAIAWVVAGLQLARAAARLGLRRDVHAAFGIPARRNALNAALLVAEAAVISGCLMAL